MIVGVSGRRPNAITVNRAKGREVWVVRIRQGVVEVVVLGEMVRVIA